MSSIVCSIIIPMYNEEEVIKETYYRLKKVMDQSNQSYELLFVNDGSRIAQRKSLQSWHRQIKIFASSIFLEISATRLR